MYSNSPKITHKKAPPIHRLNYTVIFFNRCAVKPAGKRREGKKIRRREK
jgi:hypothetical protein